MNFFMPYRRTQITEMRPYAGEDLAALVPPVSISAPDKEAGSPKDGDMIARNPANHDDQWLVAAKYFADNFEPLEDKPSPRFIISRKGEETSSRVSSIAAAILSFEPVTGPNSDEYNDLLEKAKTLAGSCLSQDETPGQATVKTFLDRLHEERDDLAEKLEKLTEDLASDKFNIIWTTQRVLLEAQRIHMSEYLAVLDARLADLGISERSAPITHTYPDDFQPEKTL